MNTPFTTLSRNFKSINIEKEIDKILNSKNIRLWLSSLVKERLRDTGTDYEGSKLSTYDAPSGNVYTYYTQLLKQKKGQPTDRVTLEDTGDFYKTFKVKTIAAITTIMADFTKEDGNIADNLDVSKVLGWTDEDINDIVMVLVHELTIVIQKKILNGFA